MEKEPLGHVRRVVCAELGEPGGSDKHRHVTAVGVEDDDGSVTRWDALDVVDAIHHGDRFVVAAPGEGELPVEGFVCADCRRGSLAAPGNDQSQDDALMRLDTCD